MKTATTGAAGTPPSARSPLSSSNHNTHHTRRKSISPLNPVSTNRGQGHPDRLPHWSPLARRARPQRTRAADPRGACEPTGDSIGDPNSIPAAARRQAWTYSSGRSVPAASCSAVGNPDCGSRPSEASIPASHQSRSGSPGHTIFNGRSASRSFMRRAYCRAAAGGKGNGSLVEPGEWSADRWTGCLAAPSVQVAVYGPDTAEISRK